MVKETSTTVRKLQNSTGIKAFFPVQNEAASRNTAKIAASFVPSSSTAKPSGAIPSKKRQRENPPASEPKKSLATGVSKSKAPTRAGTLVVGVNTNETSESADQWAAYDRCEYHATL